MKKTISLLMTVLVVTLFTTSCVTNYYFVELQNDTSFYTKADSTKGALSVIPKGTHVYISSTKKKKDYSKIRWGNFTGWSYKPVYEKFNENKNSPKATSYKTNSSTGGTVNVKGYYRKDGTYVKPHTRKAPSRKR